MAVHRNRVIYQSEALFVSPDSTGYHFTGSAISNAEVPGDYASISSTIGDGPFGLMTPPTGSQQVFGGTAAAPATNKRNEVVGWLPGDAWPQWNGKGEAGTAGVKSKVSIAGANAIGEIVFEADRTGDSYDGIKLELTQVAGGNTVAFFGTTLTVGADFAAGVTYDDLLAIFATQGGVTALSDAGGFSVAKGADPFATATRNGITFTANDKGAAKNGINFRVVDNAVPSANFAGGTLTIGANITGGADVNSVIATLDSANGLAALTAAGFTAALSGNGADLATVGTIASAGADSPKVSNGVTAGGFDGVSYAKSHGTIIKQLKRIQTANYGFTISRQDVNQFGHLARLDSVVIEAPTVNLDFSYYLLDGYNERMIEFITNGTTNTLSGGFSPELYQAGSNFFILTMPEAGDAVNGDVNASAAGNDDKKSVISLGNGYLTDYSVDISVGAIPTASVTVEGMNIKSDIGETGNDLPAIKMTDGSFMSNAWDKNAAGERTPKANGCTGLYSLPAAESGYAGCGDVAALRPGDVVLDLQDAGLISKQVSGLNVSTPTIGSAHVQSVSINIPMARTTLQRLGSTFGFSKTLDVPINITMSVSATLSDLKEGNMADLLCGCDRINATVKMMDPECVECDTKDGPVAMIFELKGARLESENFTSTIGDNKSVDLTFIAQIAGADDPDNGLFIFGKESTEGNFGLPPAWTGVGGVENIPAANELMGYRA
jgi:hypothetical protein